MSPFLRCCEPPLFIGVWRPLFPFPPTPPTIPYLQSILARRNLIHPLTPHEGYHMVNLEKQLPDPVSGRALPQLPCQSRYSKCFLDDFRFLLSLNDEEIDAFLKEGRISRSVKDEGTDGTKMFPDNRDTMPNYFVKATNTIRSRAFVPPPTSVSSPLMRQPKSTRTSPTPDALTLLAASIPLPPPSAFELTLIDNSMASELHDLCDEMFESIGNKDLEWAADSTKSMGSNTAKPTSIKKFLGKMKKVGSTINLKSLRKTKIRVIE